MAQRLRSNGLATSEPGRQSAADGASLPAGGSRGSAVVPLNLIPGQWLVTGLAMSAAALMFVMWRAHFRLFFPPTTAALYAFAAVLAGLLHLRRRHAARWFHVLQEFSGHFLAFLAISLMAVVASYPAAAATVGYADHKLERIDQALHFDWVSWYRTVSMHPVLQWCGETVYASIFVTPVILLGYLAYAGRRCEARLFLINFWIAALLTLLLFHWIPARGPLAALWQGRIPYMPMSALYQSQLIPELRAHAMTQIDLGALRGLVCAPSFHTTAAVIFCCTAWPIRALRWPLLALNAAMLLSVPVEGTHYLADMLGGAMVALVSTLATAHVARRVKPKAVRVAGEALYLRATAIA